VELVHQAKEIKAEWVHKGHLEMKIHSPVVVAVVQGMREVIQHP
jgi:hypothetical protein